MLLDRTLAEPPARPSAAWGPAPDVLPLLLDVPEPTTAVVVRVDKSGGEILLAGGTEPGRSRSTRSAATGTPCTRRAAAGGST